jgi:hypothetical protein
VTDGTQTCAAGIAEEIQRRRGVASNFGISIFTKKYLIVAPVGELMKNNDRCAEDIALAEVGGIE